MDFAAAFSADRAADTPIDALAPARASDAPVDHGPRRPSLDRLARLQTRNAVVRATPS